MKLLLPLLFLFVPSVSATTNVCQEIVAELTLAEKYGIVSAKEAQEIYLRCLIHQKFRQDLSV